MGTVWLWAEVQPLTSGMVRDRQVPPDLGFQMAASSFLNVNIPLVNTSHRGSMSLGFGVICTRGKEGQFFFLPSQLCPDSQLNNRIAQVKLHGEKGFKPQSNRLGKDGSKCDWG